MVVPTATVIPETESLHYLQGSQGRSRRRTLSTRSRNFLIGVRKVCATGPHETTPTCTNLVAASNASCRKCWSTRTCKRAASHSKFADTWYLGGSTPPPGTTPKYSRFKLFVLMWNSVKSPRSCERYDAPRSYSDRIGPTGTAAEF